MSLPFRAEDVLPRIGYSVSNTKRQNYICPWCGGKQKKLNWNFKKQVYRCNQNEEHHGNILNFYSELYGVSTKEAYKELLKLTGNDGISEVRMKKLPKAEIEEKENPLADIGKRDAVYSKWILLSPLSERHIQDLEKRGFKREEIEKLGYGSLKSYDIDSKIKLVNSLNFDDYAGIPPFYITKKGNWFPNIPPRSEGIITPFLDVCGRKRVLQVRKNNELVKKDEGKCFYLTSNGKNGGTPSAQFVHYACDFLKAKGGRKIIDVRNGSILLTEGVIKADLYHAITRMPAMSVPGVNCHDALERELPKLKKLGVTTIIIAFDMDRVEKIEVMAALDKVGKLITSYGFECRFKEWGTEYVTLRGAHGFLDTYHQFVITTSSYNKMLERSKTAKNNIVDVTLEKAKEHNRTQIIYAFENSEDAKDNKELYYALKEKVKGKGMTIMPVFWKLKYKAIDDLYAYTVRGIEP